MAGLDDVDLLDWLEVDGVPEKGSDFYFGGVEFVFMGPLGEGSFGKTFHVAMKDGLDLVFKIYKDVSPVIAREVKKEFERARALEIPNCAHMKFLLRREDGVIGFAYEFIEGKTLESVIRTHRHQLSSDRIREICIAVFGVLEQLHERRFVHKDVKPANIIILPDDRGVSLIDFGLLAPVNHGTKVGAGTPEYMAPEAVAANNASFQFDLYGACASLLELIVGPKTFDSCFTLQGSPSVFVFKGLAADDLTQLDPLSRNIARQLAKGLAFEPRDRPRSVSDLIDLIKQVDNSTEPDGTEVDSQTVRSLLQLRKGFPGVLPQDSDFARETHVDTQLFVELVPRLLAGEFDAIFLSGNPGDGKTTFLNSLALQIAQAGGSVLSQSDLEWSISRNEMTFHAMLDASESDGDVSSDVRIEGLLGKLGVAHNVVLLAINDGRIDSFMRSHSDQFDFAMDVQDQLRGKSPRNPRIVVIDLKRRALVRADMSDERGLGVQILLRLTDDRLWTECSKCVSREVCPILDNKIRISRDAALEGVEQLLAVSHYRREQRATFRDIRSVFAYMLTGDRDCKSVHAARRDGRDLRKASDSLFFDLVFAGNSGDHLLESWKALDPARLPLAEAGRRVSVRNLAEQSNPNQRTIASFAREAFFGANVGVLGTLEPSEWSVYRHFDRYRELLRDGSVNTLAQLLSGLSRILGARSPLPGKLSIAMSDRLETWTVQRDFDETKFKLEVDRTEANFVEFASDTLKLTYQPVDTDGTAGQVSMYLTLDDFELILRADSGEIFNDVYSKAVIAKFSGFASRLRLRETQSVTIVGPANEVAYARVSGSRIELSRT